MVWRENYITLYFANRNKRPYVHVTLAHVLLNVAETHV